jgi:hypothetical protein
MGTLPLSASTGFVDQNQRSIVATIARVLKIIAQRLTTSS